MTGLCIKIQIVDRIGMECHAGGSVSCNASELEDPLVYLKPYLKLAVRVWGSSCCFCELDHVFKMRINRRHCYDQ